MAIATQDPPKEKRDKEILEEDYKSYDSKADEDNNNNNNQNDVKNDNAQINDVAQNNDADQAVADIIKDVADANVNNNVDVPVNDNKDADYPADNQDSNNAEETYRDFEENAKVAEGGFKKAAVPDFKGPTNERQTAVVAAFQHAWTGYKKFAWGHDHLR
jgi:hypothetical protein